ncbi:class I SAM-dependent methyltransferase [Clostridium felsineum]|uniref:2-methoxy-6-polyprenyl-1,4-benzoquinol methylase, mitochondrial n=1 Tax=Clostridium felsineum TaxID=36839 RepID=A0A1S8LPH8_9CLOT|nr:class I SAM-dependent methyltransferase [Clostridium felsineum]MCR3761701.1 class I SAM-dependent methyltransferase [Clostridium felsineum]URZ01434.1 2-methoxy-6-polyprenyl-1,4-benzoquinol methylase, mitochondrial [Clostridium felsineum]URZ05722.1 2-methoxy-6-polyprenyl-1,4-benzoquinol methylase, mitochondrial [Clostridium felsineum]URZ10761.1 2-methoxy-6-polyprenyl-1,4-benzoquinol methylase, mitochondrial [Clostridium felsineum]URZ15515.1 2-methoxy-6-polyprenyl-1,4-benzoquinol methylase, m
MRSIQYFDNIAANWNVIRSEYFEERLKYKVLSKVDVRNKIVADFGCGTGFISLKLAEEANMVFSLDNSNNMLKELKKSAYERKFNNIHLLKSSLTNVTLFDESIDDVFINMALHHIKDADLAIKEMYRVLKKGGNVVISDVSEHNGEWAREEMFDQWLGFSNEQIYSWLKNAGFKGIDIENTDLKCKGTSSRGEYTEASIFIARASK